MLNDDRLHVSLATVAISKDACFDASMLKLFLLSFSSSSAPSSPSRLLQGVFCPMFVPAGINSYMRHGARGVSGVSSSGSVVSGASTSSDPGQTHVPTSTKSLFGICGIVGTFLLGLYAGN